VVRRGLRAPDQAAEQGVKQQDLAAEAYSLLFAKYHKPEIAV
jgi:hypothetical protein